MKSFINKNIKKFLALSLFIVATFVGLSFMPARVSALANYNGELIKTATSSGVYLVDNGAKRVFPSGPIFSSYFYHWSDIVTISTTDLGLIPDGAAMTDNVNYQDDQYLAKTADSSGVYLVDSEGKHAFPSGLIFSSYFYHWSDIVTVSTTALDDISSGADMVYNVNYRNGQLIKTADSSAVYLVESGTKRVFLSGLIFSSNGYHWSDIVTISDIELGLIPGGAAVNQLTIVAPTVTLTKPYDGDTTVATCTPGSLTGVISGDTVIATCVATYATATVGTGKTITVVYTLGGTDAAKYVKPVDGSVATGVITDSTAPALTAVTHNETAKTITYTWSEPIQLCNDATTPCTESAVTAAKMDIYTVVNNVWNEGTLTAGVEITSATFDDTDTILTITYTGNLETTANTDYVVDSWGYDIIDMAGNRFTGEVGVSPVFTVDAIAPDLASSVTHNETAKTITYNFSEPVQFINMDTEAVVAEAGLPAILKIFVVTDGDFGINTITPNATIQTAAFSSNNTVLTLTYTGNLVNMVSTNYIINPWTGTGNWAIRDLAGNDMTDNDGSLFTVVADTAKVISGVTAPAVGVAPVTTVTADQYTGTVTWSPTVATNFVEGTVYTATINLTAKANYTLTGVPANFFTVAGASFVANPADSGVVTATFPVTALLNKAALTSAITAEVGATHGTPVYVLTLTDYTTVTKNAYVAAIDAAIVAEGATNITQAEVSAATASIGSTKTALVTNVAADGLEAAKTAEGLLTSTNYVSYTAVTDALALPEVTNTQILAKTTAINSAVGALVFAGEAALDQAKIDVTTPQEADYTPASWVVFTDVVVGERTTALLMPETTNTQVVAKTAALNAAIAHLVLKTSFTAIDAISGTSKVGQTLTAGALTPLGATVTYQWKIDDAADGTFITNISGATSSTYIVDAANVGKYLKVVATANGDYTGTATSAASAVVAPAAISIAAIPGVTIPATGETPVSTTTTTAQYTGTVEWVPAVSNFAETTIYTAYITLTPTTGYTLAGVGANFFTVAGATGGVTNAPHSGLVTAIFPATIAMDKSLLTAAISAEVGAVHGTPVHVLTQADYTTGTWTPYNSAIDAAIATEANTSATQAAVDSATALIASKITALVFAGEADLLTAEGNAATKTEADYTIGSWGTLTTARALPHSTQAEIAAKTTAINNAITALVFAGKADLDAAKLTAAGKVQGDYTVGSWSTLTTALALPETTNAEVVTKTTAINNAITALVLQADQTAADATKALITALPTPTNLTLANAAAVTAARDSYIALTANQKLLVTNLAVLTAAETQIAALTAADAAVTTAEGAHTQGNVNAAQTLIDAVTAGDAKTALQGRINVVQGEVDVAAAAATSLLITNLPAVGALVVGDDGVVTTAENSYTALTTAQRALVLNDATLTAARTQVNALIAATATVVTAETLITKTQGNIDLANTAIGLATAGDAKTALHDRIVIVQADVTAAAATMALITGLPVVANLVVGDDGVVTTAENSYGALTVNQQALVANYATLTTARTQVNALIAAGAAITTFEGAHTSGNLTSANTAMSSVTGGTAKTTLQGRIDAVVAADLALANADSSALGANAIRGENPDLEHITVNLTSPLPSAGFVNNSTITWVSNNPGVVSNAGVVTRPVSIEGIVTMTATITNGTATVTKVFNLTVIAQGA